MAVVIIVLVNPLFQILSSGRVNLISVIAFTLGALHAHACNGCTHHAVNTERYLVFSLNSEVRLSNVFCDHNMRNPSLRDDNFPFLNGFPFLYLPFGSILRFAQIR